MAARFLVAGGNGLWNDVSNWSATSGGASGASFPVAADTVAFDSLSGNADIIVNVVSDCASLVMSGTYAGTLTFDSTLTLTSTCTFLGTCTLAGTAGQLIIDGSTTITSGGKTIPCALKLSSSINRTILLADDWVVSGLVEAAVGSGNTTINGVGRTLTCAGGFQQRGTSVGIIGTAKLVISGGTWDSISTGALGLDVDLAGNVTVSGAVAWGASGKTLRYVSGTITTAGSTLTCATATTWDTAGVTWNNVNITGAALTYTLTSNLAWSGTLTLAAQTWAGAGTLSGTGAVTVAAGTLTLNNTGGLVTTGTLTLPDGACTFAGTAGFTVGTLTTAALTISRLHTLTFGNTYTVTTSLANVGATGTFRQALKSSVPGSKVVFTVNPGAAVSLTFCDPTDIDSSGGQPVRTVGGVITTSTNWDNSIQAGSASFTNFCCRAGGNNLNAGTVDGSAVEPAVTPLATYTGGDWNATTDIYTAPVGADLTEAVVGRFASLYHDGDVTTVVNQFLIARITAVNAGTRQITLSTSSRSLTGTEVVTGTGNRSMRIGGAWAGDGGGGAGSNSFAFGCYLLAATVNIAGDSVRLNLKNDKVYSVTGVINFPTGALRYIQGYASSYGDGGRAVLQGPAAGASINLVSPSLAAPLMYISDLEITRNGATGTSSAIRMLNAANVMRRVVVHDVRGAGFDAANSGTELQAVECEAYACNQANSANIGAFTVGSGKGMFRRCVAHDNVTSNTSGFQAADGSAIDCVSESNGLHGFWFTSGAATLYNCDTYNNGGSGLTVSSANGYYAENCNFVKNGAHGVNAGTAGVILYLFNCGFGSGAMINALGYCNLPARLDNVNPIEYPPGVTPWVDPANGDFRLNLAAAQGTGRGQFLQTAAGYAGTLAFPDIGAAQTDVAIDSGPVDGDGGAPSLSFPGG